MFLNDFFATNMSQNMVKDISKNLTSKYSQKVDDPKQPATDALKTASKRAIQRQHKQLVIGMAIKSQTKIRKVSRTLPQNS